MEHPAKIRRLRHLVFLKDVLLLSLTGFGGPQHHITQFTRLLVDKKKYLTREEFLEIYSFCQVIPGPSSTQTLMVIAHRFGGSALAIFSLLLWVLPASSMMAVLALLLQGGSTLHQYLSYFRFLPAMTIGFIAYAAFHLLRMMIHDRVEAFICLVSAVFALIFPHPAILPVLLVFGGLVTNFTSGKTVVKPADSFKNIRWGNLVWLGLLFVGSAVLAQVLHSKPILLFENTFRFGSLVYGGGNVLIPMLFDQYVSFKHYLSAEDFMTGAGMVQALPGPVFCFSTFVNAMALDQDGWSSMLMGSIIGTVGIFLPGALLVFFLLPLWDRLKTYNRFNKAIEGINAASAGLVISAVFLLSSNLTFDTGHVMVVLGTILLLSVEKIPSPFIVLGCLLCGALLPG